jgi:serine/threonine protein kinase
MKHAAIYSSKVQQRLWTMQLVEGSKNFPKNYGYVVTDRKICIYQEQARWDLTTFFSEGNSLSESDQLPFVTSIVDAMLELEMHRMYHRDVRPDNVLVFEDALPNGTTTRRFLLTDLGLVHSYDDAARCLAFLGVVDMFSPEEVEAYYNGQEFVHTQAQELWALGLLMEAAFSGYMHPLQAILDEIERNNGDKEQLLPQFRQLVDLLPPPRSCYTLAHIEQNLLQKNPHERMSLQAVRETIRQIGNQSGCTIL